MSDPQRKIGTSRDLCERRLRAGEPFNGVCPECGCALVLHNRKGEQCSGCAGREALRLMLGFEIILERATGLRQG